MAQFRSRPRDSRLSFPVKVAAFVLVLIVTGLVATIGGIIGPSDYSMEWNADGPSSISSEIQHTSSESNDCETDTPNFLKLGTKYWTDKVTGSLAMPDCKSNPTKCLRPNATTEQCKVYGHFYDSTYQKWLGPLANEEFQFLEIGFNEGRGFDAFSGMMPLAEKHSMEIACIEQGRREDGKWPYGNFAAKNKNYESLIEANRLHCGDASTFQFLSHTWTKYMRRPDAPPLRVVVDDGSHLSEHMAATVFFWLPRIAPGGILIVEDIESYTTANRFRTNLITQLVMDLHYCGLTEDANKGNRLCFPTLQPFLKGISCELHICVLERNDRPAVEYDEIKSMPPPNALDIMACLRRD